MDESLRVKLNTFLDGLPLLGSSDEEFRRHDNRKTVKLSFINFKQENHPILQPMINAADARWKCICKKLGFNNQTIITAYQTQKKLSVYEVDKHPQFWSAVFALARHLSLGIDHNGVRELKPDEKHALALTTGIQPNSLVDVCLWAHLTTLEEGALNKLVEDMKSYDAMLEAADCKMNERLNCSKSESSNGTGGAPGSSKMGGILAGALITLAVAFLR